MKAALILSLSFIFSVSTAKAESPYDLVVNYCLKKETISSAAEVIEAMSFLTYSENKTNPCTGSSHIEFIFPDRYFSEKFAAEVAVSIRATCSEAQTRLLTRITEDQRFAKSMFGYCPE